MNIKFKIEKIHNGINIKPIGISYFTISNNKHLFVASALIKLYIYIDFVWKNKKLQ